MKGGAKIWHDSWHIQRVPRLAVMMALIAFSLGASAEAQLVMFNARDCTFCEAWDREVGRIYARTAEGRRAPLRRLDIEQRTHEHF